MAEPFFNRGRLLAIGPGLRRAELGAVFLGCLLGLLLGCSPAAEENPPEAVRKSGPADPAPDQGRFPAQAPGQIQAASPAVDEELTVLRVPWPDDPALPSIFFMAQETGILKRNHLEFEYTEKVPMPQFVAAVVSGRIDIGPGSHINRTIAGVAAGAKIRAVVGNTETSRKVPHMAGLIRKNSPIKGPFDLIGKKIGIPAVAGCNEYTPYAYLAKGGIKDPKSKAEVIVIPEKNLEQALRQGEIDLAMMHKEPEQIRRE
ncbi:MAG: ABC transporter substrate-binding protein, partial [Deltaproteobacteria bacterium]|nr:ABC transporter substrate-binding protein [Deltaproteobacteria bacterium]